MIVITTPTGQIGRQILNNILDSGKSIRVIARDPSRLDPKVRDRVEVVQGSHDDINPTFRTSIFRPPRLDDLAMLLVVFSKLR